MIIWQDCSCVFNVYCFSFLSSYVLIQERILAECLMTLIVESPNCVMEIYWKCTSFAYIKYCFYFCNLLLFDVSMEHLSVILMYINSQTQLYIQVLDISRFRYLLFFHFWRHVSTPLFGPSTGTIRPEDGPNKGVETCRQKWNNNK
jgi:hypothetical protein